MKSRIWIGIALLTTVAVGVAQSPPTSQPSGRATTLPANHYAPIVERNMFLRERRPPTPPPTRPTTTRSVTPQTLESVLVLRGVVLEEGLFRAYFENTRDSEMVRVTAGEALARGHVVEISIDAVAFESAAGMLWVKVGDNLAGTRVAAPPPSVERNPTQPSGAASEIEQRMRQRREQRNSGR